MLDAVFAADVRQNTPPMSPHQKFRNTTAPARIAIDHAGGGNGGALEIRRIELADERCGRVRDQHMDPTSLEVEGGITESDLVDVSETVAGVGSEAGTR